MKSYIKKAIPVKAKLFEKGDEDYMARFTEESPEHPVVVTLEGATLQGEFGGHYLVFGNHGDKWLVRKDIFESTYQVLDVQNAEFDEVE